ncbi:MAG: carboxypeptidase-like regulatory domain-containing protein [Gemmatimonadota bacterium]
MSAGVPAPLGQDNLGGLRGQFPTAVTEGAGALPGLGGLVVVGGWFALTLWMASAGVFVWGRGVGPLGPVQVAIFLPLLIWSAAYALSPALRAWVQRLDVTFLSAVQVLRILGAAHLVSWGAGIMAGTFALSVGIGNLLVALLALVTTYRVAHRLRGWRTWLTALTVMGMTEFSMTIALAVLGRFATPTPFDPPMRAGGYLDFRVPPLSIFPTYLIPLFLTVHLITLARLFPRRGARGAQAAAMLLAVFSLSAPQHVNAQQLVGRVLDGAARAGVAAADVAVLDSTGTAIARTRTGDVGDFVAHLPRPGSFALNVDALGYASAITGALVVGAGDVVEMEIPLSVDAIALTPILVTARRSDARTLADFRRRQDVGERMGVGVFFDREAIARLFNLATPLAQLPRMVTHYDENGYLHIGDPRCPGGIFLNGIWAGDRPVDVFMTPEEVEAVEVYRPGELPIDLRRPPPGFGPCTAIVVWTRQGATTQGGRAWLRFGILGLLAGGTALLLTVS